MPSQKAPKDPAKPGWFGQIKQTYGFAKQVDDKILLWMVGAALLSFLVLLGLGFALKAPIVYGVIGLLTAPMAALIVLMRRTDKRAYSLLEGKPGAAGMALSSIRRGGWYVNSEPVAVDGRPNGQDLTNVAMLYRIVGRPGVVLVAEGPAARAQRLLVSERKKVERLAPGAPVHTFRVSEDETGDDLVPIRKLSNKIQRLKMVLTKDEVASVNKRLRAMGQVKPQIPAGMDPNRARMNRSAMKGR